MSYIQENGPELNIGDRVKLAAIVTLPEILQLSFGKSYEVVNVGRAKNQLNDHIYVRNDHGRVVGYLRRIFDKVKNSLMVLTDDGIFAGVKMIYVNPYGQRIIIVALPDYKVDLNPDTLTGVVLLDETGFHTEGRLEYHLEKKFFTEIR